MSAAAYSIYDVLRTLIERVGWPDEQEKRVCLASIQTAEDMNLFGNLADMMACKHDHPLTRNGRCDGCGRLMASTTRTDPTVWYRR